MTMQRTMKLYRLPEASGAWVVGRRGAVGTGAGIGGAPSHQVLVSHCLQGLFLFHFLGFPKSLPGLASLLTGINGMCHHHPSKNPDFCSLPHTQNGLEG